MAEKFITVLAKELPKWPNHAVKMWQRMDSVVYYEDATGDCWDIGLFSLSDGDFGESVTRAQWEAERARILAESSKFTEQDKEHIADLTAIACGKRIKEDQALWDKAYFRAWEIGIEDGLKKCISPDDVEVITTGASYMADAFMAERAKRMKG